MNRRQFLGTMGAGAACALLPRGLRAAAPTTMSATAKRPNIIVILADDMGYSDIGCFGSEIQTPNIDRLAADGLRFTQFYNCGRCCPSRAALLTGLYPHQAGVGDMLQPTKLPGYQSALNDRCVTMAQVSLSAGYATAMSGKWHVGEKDGHWPCDRGFDHSFGTLSGAGSYFEVLPGRPWVRDNQKITPTPLFYVTDLYTDNALTYLDQIGRGAKPFFLYLAYTAPHWPVHARTEDMAKYKGRYADGPRAVAKKRWQRQVEMGLVNPQWPYRPDELVPERSTHLPMVQTEKDAAERKAAHPEEAMEMYAAQVDRMDQGIGRVVAKLKELDALDNTLILFLSDNGGCHEGRGYGQPWATASNTPFRRHKHWTHEGGISTPLVAHWPAVIRNGGKLNNSVGHITDIMPTVVELAGAKYPAAPIQPMVGSSLMPLLTGSTRPAPELLCWEHEGNRAVRTGSWKLVSAHDASNPQDAPDQWELYNLETDRTENVNLADKEPARAKELMARYDAWANRVGVVPYGQFEKNNAAKKPKK